MSIKKLAATAMRSSIGDLQRTYHHVYVDPDVEIEDILRPNFWVHHVARLTPGDLVDVVSKDFSIDVQLRVIGKEPGLVQMRLLRGYVSDAPKVAAPVVSDDELPELPDNYKVVFAPKSGWVVRTIDPPETVKTQKTKAAAYQSAIEHAAKANAVPA